MSKKNIDITYVSIMKDDIKNYRPLTIVQLRQLETLTSEEKIELIKTYNLIIKSIENLL